MRALGVAIVAAAAAFAAGCGEEDFENQPRPPVTLHLTGVIQDDAVTISPSRNLGAGPFEITISNQTDVSRTITLEGGSITDEVGPVAPGDAATVQATLDPGSYEVRAGSKRAVRKGIEPAVLDIGAERRNANSELLLP
jgi:hypothetical protein